MKKAIGQTVRDLKRGVNKKVLKVPSIEQKVLDATSNEPWGPHGSLLADIAQATRNYHEYQMIMAVIWKRINDTGKNWRHVYKALTVLEYLVANGSERVIDEIREHAYQISTLSDFQYTDSSGRDQGNNVRRKSQSLVLLVNDNERIAEARQKAAANKDKFRNNTIGGMYRPGSGVYDRYDDDRYGSRDDDRNGYGYGREREWGSRDEDQYSRDGDHYGRDNEDRYSRDGYRGDDYQYGSRSRSSDRDQDHNYDDDGQHSSRGSNAKAEDPSLKGRMDRLERKFSEQNIGAPPSYEEAVGESQSPVHSERDGENSTVSAPGGSPPPINNNRSQTSAPGGSSPVSDNLTQTTAAASIAVSANQKVEEAFDEFDPRGAGSDTTNNVEMDLLGSLSESFSSNALVLMPATSTSEANAFPNANSGSAAVFLVAPSVSNNINQAFEDPFGNSPFKAIPSTESTPSQSQVYQNVQPTQSSGLSAETVSNLKPGDSFSAMTYSASGATNTQPFPTNSQFPSQDFSTPQEETDILADILPPAPLSSLTSQQDISAASAQSAPPSYSASTNQTTSQSFSVPTSQFVQQSISAPAGQPVQQPFSATTSQHAQPFSAPTVQPLQQPFSSPTGQPVQQPFSAHIGRPTLGSVNVHGGFPSHAGSLIPGAPNITPQSQNGYNGQVSGSFLQRGTAAPFPSNMASQTPTGHMAQRANYFPQQGVSTAHSTSLMAPQSSNSHASQFNSGGFNGQQGGATPFSSPITHQTPGAPGGNQSNNVFGSLFGQAGTNAPHASQYSVSSSAGSNALVPHQPSKDKFETKSTVWVDTLSRGLVDLNISGPKTNPLADIGIDFDAINRKEKRMEKPATTSVTSTVTMGKAMGSGSGIGRAGAGALRPPANPMMGSGMGMGIGNGPGVNMSMGIGGYEGINPSMGMGGMGMDMNMGGMGQGFQMQQPTGFPSGSNPPGNYNSMMGPGSYAQQPYGGGY